MREEGGLHKIYEAIENYHRNIWKYMAVYGDGNEKRMSGEHETSKYDVFSFDPRNVQWIGASVRVGYETLNEKRYFEDRRPASMDPYLVTSKLFETTVLN